MRWLLLTVLLTACSTAKAKTQTIQDNPQEQLDALVRIVNSMGDVIDRKEAENIKLKKEVSLLQELNKRFEQINHDLDSKLNRSQWKLRRVVYASQRLKQRVDAAEAKQCAPKEEGGGKVVAFSLLISLVLIGIAALSSQKGTHV